MANLTKAFGSLSVVIPVYNAEKEVATTLDEVQGYLESSGVPNEILVVADGNTDRTAEIVRERGRSVQLLCNETNRGKGFSVRRGMMTSKMAWALFMDVDHSTRIENLDAFAEHAESVDVIIASRRVAGAKIVREQQRIRQALGKTFPYVVRALLLPEISDTQCGFKLFRRSAVESIFPAQRVERFAFDVELLLLARSLGLRIQEVPVDWDNPTSSTLRIGRDASRMLLDVFKLFWRFRILNETPDRTEG
ncbi:MAG: glycosyltransferase [Planctomycetota bacterium]